MDGRVWLDVSPLWACALPGGRGSPRWRRHHEPAEGFPFLVYHPQLFFVARTTRSPASSYNVSDAVQAVATHCRRCTLNVHG